MNNNVLIRVASRVRPFRHIANAIGLGLVLAVSGCATTTQVYHGVIMRGEVLAVDGNDVTLCIGERDGAKVGQQLDLVRHTAVPQGGKSNVVTFRRDAVGSVRIARIVDEHYAQAAVLAGQAKVGDVVELAPK